MSATFFAAILAQKATQYSLKHVFFRKTGIRKFLCITESMASEQKSYHVLRLGNLANKYMLRVNNRNTRKSCEMCSELKIRRRQ